MAVLLWAAAACAGIYLTHCRRLPLCVWFEVLYARLLAGRVLALLDGECWRLAYEWEGYRFRWTVSVILLVFLLFVGGAAAYRSRGKPQLRIVLLLCALSLSACALQGAAWEWYWHRLF